MNRRDVITTAAAAALCAALPAKPSAAARHGAPALHLVKRLRLACAWPQAAGGTYDAALDLARAIEMAMDGASVEVIATAAHEPATDFCFGSEHSYAARDPALAFIAGLPGRFALPPEAAASWLTGSGAALWQHAAARTASVIPLYAGCEGVTPSLWSRHKIGRFTGVKVAGADGMFADLLAACGASLADVPPGQWASALASGDIDAVHMASVEDALTLGLQQHAKYCLPGVLTAHGGPLALRIPAQLWHALPAEARKKLRKYVAEAGWRRHARSVQNHGLLMTAMREAHGLRLLPTTPVYFQHAIYTMSEAIVAEYSGRDALCRNLGGASMAQLNTERKTALRIMVSLNIV